MVLRLSHGGGQGAPSWVSLLVDDQFVDIGASQSFLTWANAGGITPGSYRGTGPFANMIDGYSDPAMDQSTGDIYIYGGGHGDGTCNAVVKMNVNSLTFEQVGDPAPPSIYLPGYITNGDPTIVLSYPSGPYFFGGAISQSPRNPPANFGWFLTEAEGLNATTDAGYIAPALSRQATHIYGAAVMRGTVIHYFYLAYGAFDTATGLWSGRDVDLGGQLDALTGSFGDLTNEPQAPGAFAVYDDVTDRIIVTCQSQDRAAGNRKGVFIFNPNTNTIDSYHRPEGFSAPDIIGSTPTVQVNRDIWIFTRPNLYDTNVSWNEGFIFNIDSQTWKQFEIQGDPAATYMNPSNTVAECLPCYFDGTRIVRWNYYVNANKVHLVNITPVSGTGTSADPLVFSQTERTISGAPSFSKLVYKRLYWVESAGCAVLIPEASAKPVALKLS